MEKEYLGDGLYVELVEGCVQLFTEGCEEPQLVVLEPEVLTKFLNYCKRLGIIK